MERVYDDSLITEDFVNYLQQNYLYSNGLTLFDILDKAIKKYATALQHLKHYAKNYLWETFTSLLERFQRDFTTPPSTPSSKPIVYSYKPAFPIRQVTRLPIRTPSDDFWNKSRKLLDAFLDTY
ncbi:unnamed protein product [Rhizophagus irregularis]|nr:unnamed protein product [Rhizophagus irregularis]